jgi:hypothetical protein
VDVVGRCVGATTRAVVGGWVVVGRAVVGGVVVVEAAVVGAAVVGGAVVVEAAERAAVLAGGVGGLATNPTRPSRDTRARAASGVMICSLRYHGRSGRGRGGGGAPHFGLLLVGTWVFDRAHPASMLPAKQPSPPFHAVVYTLDVLLPIVDLGQQSAWLPQGTALRWSWVLIGTGWVLTTAVVAGLAGILKRD